MIGPFAYLLEELGKVFNLSLHVDAVGACSLLFPQDLSVQLQLNSAQDTLFLFSKLAILPPGKFREEILKEGLKTNAGPDPLSGVLAYLFATNHLVLFQTYPLSILNGERLAGLFGSFLEMGTRWKEAIAKGQYQNLHKPISLP